MKTENLSSNFKSPGRALESKNKTITQNQLRNELDFIFDTYDKDKDDKLNLTQFHGMMNSVHEAKTGQQNKFSEADITKFMKLVSCDGGTSLSRQDFYKFYKKG